ncbi:hypothetical protein QUF64_13965 [Anaerolineales bacterium HSG6]|nr:hypothetical protein [Anaerolineales bacterium HSG6]MDM8530942.1 hypothetical protein [Anaerolineales bacterium HSG25]
MIDKLTYYIRFPLIMVSMLTLLAAIWAGLLRLGWLWPTLNPMLPLNHGPLIVCGFLGTLIGVERAVALSGLSSKAWWTYIGPVITAIGAIILLSGNLSLAGPLFMTIGSFCLVLVFVKILQMETASYTITMAGGALMWFIGNALWLFGWSIPTVTFWWIGFLLLTIAGERLELGRVLRLSSTVINMFVAVVLLFVVGTLLTVFNYSLGVRVAGGGMVAIALWLLRYDVARYTIKKTGLTRYIAVCLLVGYIWLIIGGLLALYFGGMTSGLYYDAMLHAVFVGFVFSMIFGHAPIIFPAILRRPITFQPAFYLPLLILHLSLLLRIIGDLMILPALRSWGGLLNGVAILMFLVNIVATIVWSSIKK